MSHSELKNIAVDIVNEASTKGFSAGVLQFVEAKLGVVYEMGRENVSSPMDRPVIATDPIVETTPTAETEGQPVRGKPGRKPKVD